MTFDPDRHEPPWGECCPLPADHWDDDDLKHETLTPRIDTADARKARNDPTVNEAAAHRAARRRAYRRQGKTSGGKRL